MPASNRGPPLLLPSLGTVWRAEQHLTLRSHVVLKLLGAEIARHPEVMERFLREAQAAAALRSLHVVQVLDYGEDQGVASIAMDPLEGESLGTRLRRVSSAFRGRKRPSLLGQVARALSQRAHEAQIVHRDSQAGQHLHLVKDQQQPTGEGLGLRHRQEWRCFAHASNQRAAFGLGEHPIYMSPEQVSASSALEALTCSGLM